MQTKLLVVGAGGKELHVFGSLLSEWGFTLQGTDVDNLENCVDKGQQALILDLDQVDVANAERALAACTAADMEVVGLITPGDVALRHIGRLDLRHIVFKPLNATEFYFRLKLALHRREHRFAMRQGYPLFDRRRGDRRTFTAAQPRAAVKIEEREKSVSVRGRTLQLSPKEYDLLALLASDPGRVFTTREIVQQVWGPASRASAEDVHEYIHLLRKKVELEPTRPSIILTVKGFGYRLQGARAA